MTPASPASRRDLEAAVKAAEEAAREVLERSLGRRLADFSVTVKAEGEEATRLTIDIEVSASRTLPREIVEAVVEEAVERGRRAFEEVLRRSGWR